jgi:hypothetical protein
MGSPAWFLYVTSRDWNCAPTVAQPLPLRAGGTAPAPHRAHGLICRRGVGEAVAGLGWVVGDEVDLGRGTYGGDT